MPSSSPELISLKGEPASREQEDAPAAVRSSGALHDVIVAISLANLCFIYAWFQLLFDADHGYFNKLRVDRVNLLALATNILGFALMFWLLLRAARHSRGRFVPLVLHLLFFALLVPPLDFVRLQFFHIADYRLLRWLKQPVTLALLAFCFVLISWQHRRVARAWAALMVILSPLALFTLVQLALVLVGIRHISQHDADPVLPAAITPRPNQTHVLWLIFDETDQRLAFEQRPANVQLPEFDRLRAQSLADTNAWPPADSTKFSIPALVSGKRLSHVALLSASDLSVQIMQTGEQTRWSKLPSIFDSARELGINTAAVGWYHPYPRVLGRSLNYCSWYPYPLFEIGRGAGFGGALWAEISCCSGTIVARQQFAKICQASIADALTVVTNTTFGLTYLHLPPPHKPGVYLPQKDSFTMFGMPKVPSYFNNLVLADRDLGKLRHAMEQVGNWDQTWVILSADHSWRESEVYDGRRDLRVPFLVKAPGQTNGVVLSSRLNTVLTHDLVLDIFTGKLATQQDALGWLEAHTSDEPTFRDVGQE